MKRVKAALALAAFAALFAAPAQAEVIKKLHSAPQKLFTSQTVNSVTYATSTVTVDLAGGDLDKASFALYITSSTTTNGSPTLDVDIQVSPDGGTTWGTCSTFTQITTTNTVAGVMKFKQDVATGPGTKVRAIIRSSSNSQWYNMTMWVIPSVN
jgi:hypothetical protein